MSPLVTVICICYNHEKYLLESVQSILNQSYQNTEIIIIDNGSSDNSQKIIRNLVAEYPEIRMNLLSENLGNCRAFNIGMTESEGDYIIDLSADDILLPDRIKEGVKSFEKYGPEYGVNFTDAIYIDHTGKVLGPHYKRDKNGLLKDPVPEGNVYIELLTKYFICTPTMMMRKSVLNHIGGYDESLFYEDFDFWIRSGKITKYCYTDKILVKKRVLKNSLSSGQYKKNSQMLRSTYLVCLKAEKLNKTESETNALRRRSKYEFRKAFLSGNFQEAYYFSALIIRNSNRGFERFLYTLINSLISPAR